MVEASEKFTHILIIKMPLTPLPFSVHHETACIYFEDTVVITVHESVKRTYCSIVLQLLSLIIQAINFKLSISTYKYKGV
jgi:hypothetical protein